MSLLPSIPTLPLPVVQDAKWTWWFETLRNRYVSLESMTDFQYDFVVGSDVGLGYGSATVVCTAQITVDAAWPDALITICADAPIAVNTEGSYYHIFRLLRNNTEIYIEDWYGGVPDLRHLFLLQGDVPGPGTHTYELEVSTVYADATYTVVAPTLLVARFTGTL